MTGVRVVGAAAADGAASSAERPVQSSTAASSPERRERENLIAVPIGRNARRPSVCGIGSAIARQLHSFRLGGPVVGLAVRVAGHALDEKQLSGQLVARD